MGVQLLLPPSPTSPATSPSNSSLRKIDRRMHLHDNPNYIFTKQALNHLGRLFTTGLIRHLPTLRAFLSHHNHYLPPPLLLSLSLHHFPPHSSTSLFNSLISTFSKRNSLLLARYLFDQMPHRNHRSWTAIIAAYARAGHLDSALALLERMPAGADNKIPAWNSLISGFARQGLLALARHYFDVMPRRNLVSYNAMLSGYVLNGDVNSAQELFGKMTERDVVSWSCMMAAFARSACHVDALQLFDVMLKDGQAKPNEVTMVSVLSACAQASALEHGKWVHSYIEKERLVLDDDRNLGAALIDMYSKCGDIESALAVFHGLRRRNVSSWNTLITGLAVNGYALESLLAFEEMQLAGTEPDDVTFVGVLSACTHGGLVDEGRSYFKRMFGVYGVRPEIKHYGCMVDMLGRAGLLEEAEGIVKRMPMKPDVMVLGALLGACKIHGDFEVAERVRSGFMEMSKSEQGGCHYLLSNIYAAAHRWADACKMRENLQKNGIMKEVGSSSVEMEKRI